MQVKDRVCKIFRGWHDSSRKMKPKWGGDVIFEMLWDSSPFIMVVYSLQCCLIYSPSSSLSLELSLVPHDNVKTAFIPSVISLHLLEAQGWLMLSCHSQTVGVTHPQNAVDAELKIPPTLKASHNSTAGDIFACDILTSSLFFNLFFKQ